MSFLPVILACAFCPDPGALTPGDHTRSIEIDGRRRSYLVHVPESYDAEKPTPVVLVFHGFGADGASMVRFCGMNEKADQAGFIAVYPFGTGANVFRLFNGGGAKNEIARSLPDDVRYVKDLLADVSARVNVDPRRVYATGFSNGAMMCYRLAVEMAERVAAIATVAGTMANGLPDPTRPVPVLHFHGTADPAFSFGGNTGGASEAFDVKSVDETVRLWAKVHKCSPEPVAWEKDDEFDDGTTIRRQSFQTPDRENRVVLYVIDGGGHNWPGQEPPWFLGTCTREISASDLIWEFFQKHALPP